MVSLFFLLLGIAAGIFVILPDRSVLSALSLVQMTLASRTFLEEWLTLVLIPTMPLVSLGFILIAGISFLIRYKEQRLIQKFATAVESAEQCLFQDNRSIFGMPGRYLVISFVACSALVLIQYWPTLIHGFFRYDDFRLLTFIRTHSLWESVFVPPFDDHTYSLFRLWLAAMAAVFGVSPLPYNIILMAIFILMVFFAVLIMREMNVTPLAILIAVTFLTGVVTWGETMAGYYTQAIHPLSAFCCLAAIWALLRWEKTSRSILAVAAVVAMAIPTFVDISGSWVPLAVLTFAVCHGFAVRQRAGAAVLGPRSWIIWSALGILILAVGFNVYVFSIVAPGHFLMLVDDAMPPGVSYSLTNISQQFFFIVAAGLLLPLFPIGYWKLPALVLVPALALLTLVTATGLFIAWKRMDRLTRWFTVSVVLIMLGTSLMVVLARQYHGFAHAWPSKYIGTPYLWTCILVGLACDTLWKRANSSARATFLKLTGLVLALFLTLQTVFDIAASRIDSNPPGNGSGYRSNINDAKLRKAVLEQIRNDFIIPIVARSSLPVHLPTLDDRHINDIYPSHDPFNNFSYYRDFIVPSGKEVTFLRNNAMREASHAKDVKTVTSLRSTVNGAFIEALKHDGFVQRLYLSSVPLDFRRRECKPPTAASKAPNSPLTGVDSMPAAADGRFVVKSGGDALLTVRKGWWDPETAHHLDLAIQGLSDNREPIRLQFGFSGELKIPYPSPWIELTDHQAHCVAVDLLQVYAYALNPKVNDLIVRLRTPGTYRISQIDLRTPR